MHSKNILHSPSPLACKNIRVGVPISQPFVWPLNMQQPSYKVSTYSSTISL